MKELIILLAFLCNISWNIAPNKGEKVQVFTYKMSDCLTIDTTYLNNLQIRPFHLEIVPPSSGVQFYRNGIIFLSHSKAEEKVPENHLSFGSLRTYTTIITDTVPGNLMPFTLDNQVIFPSEATTFTSDHNTMYFSFIPEKSRSEKIFRADNTLEGWKIEKNPLDICSGNHIYSHPCLSADGTFMVFSSDMSGTVGGLDLYISNNMDGKWSEPKNLGKEINSAGNELFASLDASNNLYFSSDGLPGKGGYDIFICRYNGNGWDEPHNLSEKINTEDDEVAFAINKSDNGSAFYTVRARSGKNKTQLNSITLNPESGKTVSNLSQILLAEAGIKDLNIPAKPLAPVLAANAVAEKPEVKKPPVEQKATPAKVQQEQPVAVKEEVPAPKKEPMTVSASDVRKDVVVYRVQILANTKPVGSYNVTIAGKAYKSFEYLYKGGYRTTVGEFSTPSEAAKFQNTCRQNGYKEAFVVAFKNNIRSTDPELFK